MASTRLYRTQGTPTNADKWTFSVWVKSSNADEVNEALIMGTYVDSNNYEYVGFNSQKKISYLTRQGGSNVGHLLTTRTIKDPAAWYHFVYVYDTAASAADRMRIYVNGVEVTAFTTDTNPTLNLDSLINTSGNVINIGTYKDSGAVTNEFFQGVMAHAHFCDGQAYAASDFGETDTTSGIWVAKSGPSVTYGDNGFFLKFASGALGTDSSGEGNNFTVSGTMTNTKDTPDNNFCTLDGGLVTPNSSYDPVYSNGNTTVISQHTTALHDFAGCGNVALTAGLWYWEVNVVNMSGDAIIGIIQNPLYGISVGRGDIGYQLNDYGLIQTGNYRTNNGEGAYGVSYVATDTIGVYLDLTANKLYWAKNGVIMNSGTGYSITAPSSLVGTTSPTRFSYGAYMPAASSYATTSSTFSFNFGNGYFGTTAVTSGVADAGGEGTFEYDPSDGGASSFDGSAKDFRAICTNNLATYG